MLQVRSRLIYNESRIMNHHRHRHRREHRHRHRRHPRHPRRPRHLGSSSSSSSPSSWSSSCSPRPCPRHRHRYRLVIIATGIILLSLLVWLGVVFNLQTVFLPSLAFRKAQTKAYTIRRLGRDHSKSSTVWLPTQA